MASYKDYYNGIMPPKPPKAGNQSSGSNMDWMKKYMPLAPPPTTAQQPAQQQAPIRRWIRSQRGMENAANNPMAFMLPPAGFGMQQQMPGYGFPTTTPVASMPVASSGQGLSATNYNPFLRPAQMPVSQGQRPWGMDNSFLSAAGMPLQQQMRSAVPMGNPYLPRMS